MAKLTKEVHIELDQIADTNNGVLDPADVVLFASVNKQSALHGKFEWDDLVAGHEYRLWQARSIINVYVRVLPQANVPYRAYVSLMEDRHSGGGYRRTVDVLSDDEMRCALLSQALRELISFENRYKSLAELAPVFEAIGNVRATHQAVRQPALV